MPSPKTEKQWEAESDAGTLAQAEVITNTPTRLRAAKTAAKKLAADQEKQARGMRKVATGKVRKTGAKPGRSKR